MKRLSLIMFSSLLALSVGSLIGCGSKKCEPTPSEEPVPAHEHTFSSDWSSNATSHWHAATCEHKTFTSDLADHTFGQWTVVEPTETAEGRQTRECSICHYVQTEVLPKKAHEHEFADAYTADDEYHWHEAICEHDLISGLEEHDYGDWRQTVAPTETIVGKKERTCRICEHVQEADVEKTPHTHVWGEWIIDEDPTEAKAGKKHRECACGATQEEVIDQLEHVHTYSNAWTSNSQGHWHEATCGHSVTTEIVAHTPDREAPDRGNPIRCSICGYVMEESYGNSAVDMGGGAYTIRPLRERYFNIELYGNAKTEIKVNVDFNGPSQTASGNVNLKLVEYDNHAKTTIKDFGNYSFAQLREGRLTLTSGVFVQPGSDRLYQFVVHNTSVNNITLHLANVSYEYKSVYSKNATHNGVTYKIEEFKALNGVDDVYYNIYKNNELMESYRNLKIVSPRSLKDGLASWTNGNGEQMSFVIPHTVYKSAYYKTCDIWYVDEYYSNAWYLYLTDYVQFYQFLKNDTAYGQPNMFAPREGFTIDEQLIGFSYFVENSNDFCLTIYNYGNQFDVDNGYYMYGLYDYDTIGDDAVTAPYDETNHLFSHNVSSSGYSELTSIMRVSIPNDRKFDKFKSYDNNNQVRDPNKTTWAYPFLFSVLDEDYNEVAGYNTYTLDGFRKNADGDNMNLMPGKTYYIVAYKWLFHNKFEITQRMYNINVIDLDNNIVKTKTTPGLAGWTVSTLDVGPEALRAEALEEGVAVIGYSTNLDTYPNYQEIDKPKIEYYCTNSIRATLDDVDLYRVYIPTDNVIATRPTQKNTDLGYNASTKKLTLRYDQCLDGNVELVEGDAVFVYDKYGSRIERFVESVTFDQATGIYTTIIGNVYESYGNGWTFVALETEFEYILLNTEGDDWYEGTVAKGQSVELFDFYDWCSAPAGKYFDHWQDDDYPDIIAYNATIFTPTHSCGMISIFYDIAGSGLLAEKRNMTAAENQVGAAYLEFTIMDGTLTLNSDSTVSIYLKDGTIKTDSVFRILDSNGGTINSATSATGKIRVFFNDSALTQLNNAVMIKIA